MVPFLGLAFGYGACCFGPHFQMGRLALGGSMVVVLIRPRGCVCGVLLVGLRVGGSPAALFVGGEAIGDA